MPFSFPSTALYKDCLYRVVHSPEEFAAACAKGWSDSAEPTVSYAPVSSVNVPKPAPEPFANTLLADESIAQLLAKANEEAPPEAIIDLAPAEPEADMPAPVRGKPFAKRPYPVTVPAEK